MEKQLVFIRCPECGFQQNHWIAQVVQQEASCHQCDYPLAMEDVVIA